MTEKLEICRHHEVFTDRYHSVCKYCGQEKDYNVEGRRLPKVTRRGRIRGRLTFVSPPVMEAV